MVVVIETDKVSVDVRATVGGVVGEIFAEMDDVVEVGTKLYTIDTDAKAPEGAAAEGAAAPEPAAAAASAAAPAAAAAPVAAAAPAPAAAAPPPPPAAKKAAAPPPPPPAAPLGARTERREKMSRMRQRVAVRLKEAQNTAAMLTTFQEVDMGSLMEMRSKYKEGFEKKHGVRLGFMSAFVAASTKALREIPAVNAYIDDETKEIVYRDYCDISVAVASPNGLVVPVLRNTETMGFADIERSIGAYAAKAKAGQMALEDMAGGTFTISNGGVFGSLMGTPIINPPQSAILGMHATKMRPMVVDGVIVARPMMYLALTYDHRLIDGREGVTFLKSIADSVADPGRLLLDV